jgi:hypothetical protein
MLVGVFSFLSFASQADALVSVNGYYRKDGTYVRPHYRTDPDSTTSNNFSTYGIHTYDMSASEAAGVERSLNNKYGYIPTTYYTGSKREKKVAKCQAQGNTEKYCKAKYMASKKKHK